MVSPGARRCVWQSARRARSRRVVDVYSGHRCGSWPVKRRIRKLAIAGSFRRQLPDGRRSGRSPWPTLPITPFVERAACQKSDMPTTRPCGLRQRLRHQFDGTACHGSNPSQAPHGNPSDPAFPSGNWQGATMVHNAVSRTPRAEINALSECGSIVARSE